MEAITAWDPAADGVVALPSGRLVRGRSLGRPLPGVAVLALYAAR